VEALYGLVSYWREYCSASLWAGSTREGGRYDHNWIWSDSRRTILRRASRHLYLFTRAVAANRLCVRIGRTLEKPLLLAKFFTEKFFKEFLFSKLVNNAVIDDSRRQAIGSNTFLLIESNDPGSPAN